MTSALVTTPVAPASINHPLTRAVPVPSHCGVSLNTSWVPLVRSANLKDVEVFDEVFAFDRTVSRLMEMQSEEYLTAPWQGHATVEDVQGFVVVGNSGPVS